MPDLEHTILSKRYFLKQKVGSGGSADVYQAFDRLRSADMAVKVMRQDLANDSRLIKLFEQEAAILRQLDHPYIVRLYDFDKQDKIVFFVMEWVEGSDLKQAIAKKKKPFTLEEVIRILEPVSAALTYAHNKEYFHCDIKPANILLHVDGRVLLSDFGVARRVHEQKQGGTPSYEAPEQITAGRIDARTDVYGLGVVIYEMLSGGMVPFRGDSPLSVEKTTLGERIKWERLNLPLEPLHKFNPKLSREIEAVVDKALCKEPDSRYPSVMALRKDFENACRTGKPLERVDETTIGPPPVPDPFPPARVIVPDKIHGPHLFGRSGEFEGRLIPLFQTSTTLGRGKANHLHFSEASVSRSQATVLKTRRGTYIRDENSSHGTFVNGKQIPSGGLEALHHGDVIQVGFFEELEFRER
jgi:serine/threonine protein kinase